MNSKAIVSKENIFKIGLDIHLLSFSLPEDLIQNRELRVSITTFPDLIQQHFYICAKNISCSNHVFSINITNQTKHVVIHFRRKVFLKENPIIGSKTIHLHHFQCFPKDPLTKDIIYSEVKTKKIYRPLQPEEQELQDESKYQTPRKIGSMKLQLSFRSPYQKNNKEMQKNKEYITEKDNNHKMDRKFSLSRHEKVSNEYVFCTKNDKEMQKSKDNITEKDNNHKMDRKFSLSRHEKVSNEYVSCIKNEKDDEKANDLEMFYKKKSLQSLGFNNLIR